MPFNEFADGLVEQAGLTWTAQSREFVTFSLRSSIERMVISILADFGAVEREYRKDPLGDGMFSRLDTFEITPFGKSLLDAITVPVG